MVDNKELIKGNSGSVTLTLDGSVYTMATVTELTAQDEYNSFEYVCLGEEFVQEKDTTIKGSGSITMYFTEDSIAVLKAYKKARDAKQAPSVKIIAEHVKDDGTVVMRTALTGVRFASIPTVNILVS